MLKKHFTSENNLQYYDLVKMKVERDIEEVWKVEEFQESLRGRIENLPIIRLLIDSQFASIGKRTDGDAQKKVQEFAPSMIPR